MAKYFDFINIFNNLETSLNVKIGASNTLIGNALYGGSWIETTTGLNMQEIYFTDNILTYPNLLGTILVTPYFTSLDKYYDKTTIALFSYTLSGISIILYISFVSWSNEIQIFSWNPKIYIESKDFNGI